MGGSRLVNAVPRALLPKHLSQRGGLSGEPGDKLALVFEQPEPRKGCVCVPRRGASG